MKQSHGRVVILREPARAEALRRLLIERGYDVLVRPVTRVEFLEPPPGENWRERIRQADCVVFTSLNGVKALARGVGGENVLRNLLQERIVMVVGRQSYAKLSAMEVGAHHVSPEVLVDQLISLLRPASNVLYPGAAGVMRDIADPLRNAGHALCRLVCYRTLAIRPDQREPVEWSKVDLAVVAAPSAVAAAAEDPSLLQDFLFVAIGPTTAAALEARGMRVEGVAASTDAEGVCAAIERIRSVTKK